MLEAAVAAGLAAAGADVLRVGVLPTPAVAFLTGAYGADLGVVLSASHNPDARQRHQAVRARRPQARRRHRGRDRGRGRARARRRARPAPRSGGCATPPTPPSAISTTCCGAVPHVARRAARRRRLRARRRVGRRARALPPRGRPGHRDRHRAGRAQHQRRRRLDPPRRPASTAVRATGADLGIAHDGDADRCLAVDASGAVVDGDQILALCAVALRDAGALRQDTVVATVMSNLGFHHAMRDAGIAVLTTAVGDRYVLEELRAKDLSLGGEQSGHVVFTDAATTGDGLLTALHVMARMADDRTPARRARRASCTGCRRPWSTCRSATAPRSPRPPSVAAAVDDAAARARRRRADPAASVRHRAARPGHGRGADPGRSPTRSRSASRRSSRPPDHDRGGRRSTPACAARIARTVNGPTSRGPGERGARGGAPRV